MIIMSKGQNSMQNYKNIEHDYQGILAIERTFNTCSGPQQPTKVKEKKPRKNDSYGKKFAEIRSIIAKRN